MKKKFAKPILAFIFEQLQVNFSSKKTIETTIH